MNFVHQFSYVQDAEVEKKAETKLTCQHKKNSHIDVACKISSRKGDHSATRYILV